MRKWHFVLYYRTDQGFMLKDFCTVDKNFEQKVYYILRQPRTQPLCVVLWLAWPLRGPRGQFDRFRCEAPGRIRFDFWSGLRFLERTQ
jgi:hypothetical protein